MKYLIFLSLLTICLPQNQILKSNDAVPDNNIEPEYFTIIFQNKPTIINSNGIGEIFTLKSDSNYRVESLDYLLIKNHIYFLYTETDIESTTSFILKIRIADNKILWKNEVNGFNSSSFYLINNDIFVSSISLIGKINSRNGKYIWKQINDYQKHKINFFRFKNFYDKKLSIVGHAHSDKYNIVIDILSGNINSFLKK